MEGGGEGEDYLLIKVNLAILRARQGKEERNSCIKSKHVTADVECKSHQRHRREQEAKRAEEQSHRRVLEEDLKPPGSKNYKAKSSGCYVRPGETYW